MLRQARAAGHLQGHWVTGDDAYGKVPTLRDALDAEGWTYVLDVPQTTPVFTQPTEVVVPPWSGRGRKPTTPRLAPDAAPPQSVQAVADGLPVTAWHALTVAEGAQGPRTYQFVALRVWESRDGRPGRACWLLLRRNLGWERTELLSLQCAGGYPAAHPGSGRGGPLGHRDRVRDGQRRDGPG